MSSHATNPARRGGEREAARSAAGRGGLLASGFLILSLLSLLVTPLFFQRQIRELREEIQHAADPARTAVTQVQYLLARQTSLLRGYLISGDRAYLRQYETFAELEQAVHRDLEPLARRLGPTVLTRFVELRTLSTQWHQEVEQELRAPRAETPGAVPFEQDLYQAALQASSDLDGAVLRAADERRARILAVERRIFAAQVVLVLIALVAAVAAVRLGQRVEQLAREAEARRREAERALQETASAVEAKARLLRGVTHDVKNPLGAADGYADLLQMGIHGELSEPQERMVQAIRRSIRTALETIQDLLDLARAESGELAIQRELASVAMIVREVVEQYRGAAAAAGHALELELPRERVTLHTDEARVRQILGNLLSNAIKYTPAPGRVRVEVLASAEGSGAPPGRWAAIRVADNGPGIPPEDRDRIFEEFTRLAHDSAGGHGLGLAISRRVSRLLGGELTLDSRTGEGSAFTLWLPLRGPEEA